MLHHLRAEDAVERSFGQVPEVCEQVGDFGLEALGPAEGDGFLAQIDAARGHCRRRASFPGIRRGRSRYRARCGSPAKCGQVELLAGFDVLLGAAEALGEPAVVEGQRLAIRRRGAEALRDIGWGLRRARDGSAPAGGWSRSSVWIRRSYSARMRSRSAQRRFWISRAMRSSARLEVCVLSQQHRVAVVGFHQVGRDAGRRPADRPRCAGTASRCAPACAPTRRATRPSGLRMSLNASAAASAPAARAADRHQRAVGLVERFDGGVDAGHRSCG